jgi:hypothetical protein
MFVQFGQVLHAIQSDRHARHLLAQLIVQLASQRSALPFIGRQ